MRFENTSWRRWSTSGPLAAGGVRGSSGCTAVAPRARTSTRLESHLNIDIGMCVASISSVQMQAAFMCTRYCPWRPILGTRKSEVKLMGGVEKDGRAPEHSRQADSRGRRRRVSGDGAIGEREHVQTPFGLRRRRGSTV